MTKREQKQAVEGVWALIFMVLLSTLGWNYGATELIEELGGPDANLNVLEVTLTLLLIGCVSVVGAAGTRGK